MGNADGEREPVWSPGENELLYWNEDWWMVVDVETSATFPLVGPECSSKPRTSR